MSAGFLARFQPQSTGHVKTSRVFFHEKKIQTKPTAAAPNQTLAFQRLYKALDPSGRSMRSVEGSVLGFWTGDECWWLFCCSRKVVTWGTLGIPMKRMYNPGKINGFWQWRWMERWFSVSIGWFLGPMLIFPGCIWETVSNILGMNCKNLTHFLNKSLLKLVLFEDLGDFNYLFPRSPQYNWLCWSGGAVCIEAWL